MMDSKHNRIDLPKLKEAFDRGYDLRQKAGKHPVTLRATANLVDNAYLEGRIGRFHFTCDEPPARGGEDKAPSPLEYFLIGAAF
jgi:hypothetical protein